MTKHSLIVTTQATHIHSIVFDDVARTLEVVDSLFLGRQPSSFMRSPVHKSLVYFNAWADDKLFAVERDPEGKLKIVDTLEDVGEGPTYFQPAPNGSGIFVVSYRGETISFNPILPNGLFAHTRRPSHVYTFPYTAPTTPNERQEKSHPHMIIPFGDDWLVPDLGNDRVWRMHWDGAEEAWVVIGYLETEGGHGPRHGVLSKDQHTLYLLNELANVVTVHTLPSEWTGAAAQTSSHQLSTRHILPPPVRGIRSAYGPFEIIACAIELLDPLEPSTPYQTLLATNRDGPAHLTPDGDALAIFSVKGASISEPEYFHGPGRHLRGLAIGPAEGEGKMKYVLVMGREEGGLSMYERKEGPEMTELVEVVVHQLNELDKPVGAVWMS